MSGISMGHIQYNARTASYEARVDIHAEGRTFRYPCAVPGSLQMKPQDVRSALIAQARRMGESHVPLRTVL